MILNSCKFILAIPNSKRYQQNGYNLDLACFEENRLVVMAWPADDQIFMKDMKRSKLIRNDSTEGKSFQIIAKSVLLC